MRPRWTIGRGIAAVLALVFLGFGLKCLLDGRRGHKDFERWLTAKPMDGPIDFSQPGQFTFPFDQTCSSAHSEVVALRIPAESMLGTTVAKLLAGLKSHLVITDGSGKKIVDSKDFPLTWGDETLDGAIPIFNIAPFHKGVYRATITITEGAPTLKGIPQRVEARYLLCGLERMPAVIATGVGIGSVAIGGIIGLMVAFRVFRDRGESQVTTRAVPPPCGTGGGRA